MSCSEAIACFKENISGTVLFHQCNQDGVTVIFNIKGLEPNRKFGCHIHKYGDFRKGCESLGPHWNPHNTTHGYTFDTSRQCHSGDLVGNILSDSTGSYEFIYKDPKLSLSGPLSIVGRSVVVHDGIDDLGLGGNVESLVTGNAGTRLDCAVIGWANMD